MSICMVEKGVEIPPFFIVQMDIKSKILRAVKFPGVPHSFRRRLLLHYGGALDVRESVRALRCGNEQA